METSGSLLEFKTRFLMHELSLCFFMIEIQKVFQSCIQSSTIVGFGKITISQQMAAKLCFIISTMLFSNEFGGQICLPIQTDEMFALSYCHQYHYVTYLLSSLFCSNIHFYPYSPCLIGPPKVTFSFLLHLFCYFFIVLVTLPRVCLSSLRVVLLGQ